MSSVMVIKRTGDVVDFDRVRIRKVISKAIRATAPAAERDALEATHLDSVVEDVVAEVQSRFVELHPNVENIQDIVEKHLVKHGLYEIAKAYILYRADHQKAREERKDQVARQSLLGKLTVEKRDGRKVLFDVTKLNDSIARAAEGLTATEAEAGAGVVADLISGETIRNIYDGISTEEIEKAMLMACASFIEKDPAYSHVASRLFLQRIYKEVIGSSVADDDLASSYREAFLFGLQRGVDAGLFDPQLLEFDGQRLAAELAIERDDLFRYMGVQTLYERYFARTDNAIIETPQAFWMRVAMGLAIGETDREARAIEFYGIVSTLRFVPSTPTLFHAGTTHPQLSSCYLTTVEDDLGHIFKSLSDNAQLSKWSGGLGNDWTNIRGTGSAINSTGVDSQGVIPFLKIANDVTLAINRSGKRRGATCAYLETWHLDIEDFLDLRRNTGDERRRTHDMNTANWIPDLFMKRVLADEDWTLFSPDECSDLHHLYGRAFEERYAHYEQLADQGQLARYKRMPALKLWRKMLNMLFETGHPWVTFKDPCNIRSPQDHDGVVHSSNLCTEITLNTSAEETAVCNLGSVNFAEHIADGEVSYDKLAETVEVAMRMLDNVVDINFYPTEEARRSNLRHRPVGLGMIGLQDALFMLDLAFEDDAALTLNDNLMEFVAYHAILSSSRLAAERGPYESYAGSKWQRGLLPQDTIALLEAERGSPVEVDRSAALDWGPLRQHVAEHGMRNSNTMAIAPTATISTIAGCFPSFEPLYKNIYVKSNISGEFTVTNPYLIADLRSAGLWNEEIADELKYRDGSVQNMTLLSDRLKRKYKVAFEIDPHRYLQLAAARGKWIDQSQSLNIFMQGTSGRLLSDIYVQAWKMGLKTTYYLRTLAASQVEKATLSSSYGLTQNRTSATAEPAAVSVDVAAGADAVAAEAAATAAGTDAVAAIAERISSIAADQRPLSPHPAPTPTAPEPRSAETQAYRGDFELAPETPAPADQSQPELNGQFCTDPESCEACQ